MRIGTLTESSGGASLGMAKSTETALVPRTTPLTGRQTSNRQASASAATPNPRPWGADRSHSEVDARCAACS